MGALYHLKQRLVDFCNVIQQNVSRTDTVPSSKVVYDGLAAKIDKTDIVDNLSSSDATKVLSAKQGKALNNSLSNVSSTLSNTVLRKNASGNGSFTFTMNAALAVVFIKRNDTNATNFSVYLLFYHSVTGFVVSPIHEDSDTTYTFTNNGTTVTAKSNANTYTFVQIIN